MNLPIYRCRCCHEIHLIRTYAGDDTTPASTIVLGMFDWMAERDLENGKLLKKRSAEEESGA